MSAIRIPDVYIDPDLESNADLIKSIKYATPLHNHVFYEFFLITSGKCLHFVNGQTQRLSEGALVFIRPEDTHCHEYDGKNDCQFINSAFMNKAIAEVLDFQGEPSDFHELLTCLTPPYAMLSSLEKEHFMSCCEDFRVLSTLDKKSARIHIRGMLAALLTRYFLVCRDKKNDYIPLWFESLLTQMQKQENFTAGIEKMYELSGRSSGHVNRLFKQHFGITPAGLREKKFFS